MKKLGEGGFCLVRKVRHKIKNQEFAMKQLNKNSITKEEKKNLDYEIEILEKIDHPNILRTFECYK